MRWEGGRLRGGGTGCWCEGVGVGVFRDDPSHSQESLETLSAVAAHLCLLFLVAGGGGGGRGDADSFWVSGFSHPPSEIPSVHMNTHI